MAQKKNPAYNAFVARQADISRRISHRAPHVTGAYRYIGPLRVDNAPREAPGSPNELDKIVAYALAFQKTCTSPRA